MTIKPTRRKNGHYHATIRVAFHPGRDEAVQALAAHVSYNEVDMSDFTPSRAFVEKTIRDGYLLYGSGTEMKWSDDLVENDYGTSDDIRDWAETQITRLFPEWQK